MRKLSIVCFWAFIVFVSLSVLVGITATILQFVIGDIASGFSDLLWTCINGWILAVTVGVKASEKESEQKG